MERRGTRETTDNDQKVGRQRGQRLSPCGSKDENQTAREERKEGTPRSMDEDRAEMRGEGKLPAH